MAKYLKTEGVVVDVHPKNGNDYALDELQGFVGGLIEIVYLPDGLLMVVNEEGLILGLPFNINASILAGHPIVGNALVCRSDEVK